MAIDDCWSEQLWHCTALHCVASRRRVAVCENIQVFTRAHTTNITRKNTTFRIARTMHVSHAHHTHALRARTCTMFLTRLTDLHPTFQNSDDTDRRGSSPGRWTPGPYFYRKCTTAFLGTLGTIFICTGLFSSPIVDDLIASQV
jgi:hypothetical protein